MTVDAVRALPATRDLRFGDPVTSVCWIGDAALFALGDGTVRIVSGSDDAAVARCHDGAILCATVHPDGLSLVTGGDDGRVRRLTLDGETETLGDFGSRWAEHLVASPVSGVLGAAVGKEAVIWPGGSPANFHRFAFPSTVAGLSLDGKGKRLAVAHYNGASLLWAGTPASTRKTLGWVGSHISCTLRPDGDYLITGTQEMGLHGWRVADSADMAMSGYQAKTRSFSWSRRARWLATSGDVKAVLWPFDGKSGPIGKAPLLVGDRNMLVSRVAFHPQQDVLAIGYIDGAITLARIEDEIEVPVEAQGESAVTALSWNAPGTRLAFGCGDGRAGVLHLERTSA